MKKSNPPIDRAYCWLPLLPVVSLLALFGFAGFQHHEFGQQLDKKLDGVLGDSRADQTMASMVNSNTSTEQTEVWLRILSATEGLQRRYQPFSFVISHCFTEWMVPPDAPFPIAPIVEAYARDAKPILDAMTPLLDTESSIWLPISDQGSDTKLSELQSSRSVARLLAMECASAFHSGENKRALAAIKMSHHLLADPHKEVSLPIEILLRRAYQNYLLKLIAQSLQSNEWSDDELDEIGTLLRQPSDLAKEWKSWIHGDATLVLNLLDSHGRSTGDFPMNRLISVSPSTRLIIANHLERIMDKDQTLGHILKQNQWGRADHHRRIHSDQWLNVPQLADEWIFDQFVSSPPIQIASSIATHQARVRLTQTALGVRKFRRAHQRWPRDLSELAAMGLNLDETNDPLGNPIELQAVEDDAFRIRFRSYQRHEDPQRLLSGIDDIVMQSP